MTTRRRHTVDSEFIVGPEQRGQRGWTVTQAPATTAGPIPQEMTCRDRTTEFFSAIKSLQSRQGNGVIAHHKQHHPRQQHTEFMQRAKRIGQDLSNTFAKLEKLTLLAKRKSLFDDKSVEIQELTYIIKQDINSLNKQIAQLQDFVKQRRSQNGHLQTQTHSNTVVLSLQSKLANMSNAFKNVLEVRTQNLKEQKDRREHFSQGSVTSSLPPAAAAMNGGSLLSQDVALDMSAFDDGPRHRHGMQEMQMVQQDDSYIKEREETMHSIESTIVELSGIFQQLAHMVKEQEEQVQRIDHNVEETTMNVEAAHGEILKYFQSVTSNRWLMIKVFVVLIVFFIIFIVFLA